MMSSVIDDCPDLAPPYPIFWDKSQPVSPGLIPSAFSNVCVCILFRSSWSLKYRSPIPSSSIFYPSIFRLLLYTPLPPPHSPLSSALYSCFMFFLPPPLFLFPPPLIPPSTVLCCSFLPSSLIPFSGTPSFFLSYACAPPAIFSPGSIFFISSWDLDLMKPIPTHPRVDASQPHDRTFQRLSSAAEGISEELKPIDWMRSQARARTFNRDSCIVYKHI